MNDKIINENYNHEAFRYLLIARDIYQQYLIEMQQLYSIDNQIMMSNTLSTGDSQVYNTVRLQNERFNVEMNLRKHIESVGNNAAMATINALMALQMSITKKDQINAMFYDNYLSSICSFVEMTGIRGDIHSAYKRYCDIGGIINLTNDITIQNSSLFYQLPGMGKLQILLGR